jgi:prolyl-tRNA editing enzyme YbaK/EbsC (Cys-tRNA(Pro) deacylase)
MHRNSLKTLTYSKTCKSASEAALEMGLHVSQLQKSLLIKSKKRFVLTLLSSDKKLNFEAIHNLYGESFEMATLAEVIQVTWHHIGVVSPFDLKQNIDILLDKKSLSFDVVGVGSGIRGKEIIISPKELLENTQLNIKTHEISD